MTATVASLVEVDALVERVRDTVAVLSASVRSADCLTAGYAAATLTELADKIECALVSVNPGALYQLLGPAPCR